MAAAEGREHHMHQTLRTYARMALICRAGAVIDLAIMLSATTTQFLATSSLLSEISLLGNNGLTNNSFTYINRLQSYVLVDYILFFAFYFAMLLIIATFQDYLRRRTVEVTGAGKYAGLKSMVRQNGGLLKLAFSR